ncbi:MAG: SMI1/KNR4 family protein [Pirellulaceae bacterium]
MSTSNASFRRPPSWSSALRDRYHCALTSDLSDWWDREIWRYEAGGEFDQPVSPQSLLEEAPEVIWPGFMLPDTLPILGNGYGDWLCLRFDANNRPAEVIHWYHGGGDWMPWGRTLSEAIAFDYLRSRLPGRRQYYANVAQEFDLRFGDQSIPDWAASHLPAPVAEVLRQTEHDRSEVVYLDDTMLTEEVAAIAVRCEMTLRSLDSPLRQVLQPTKANHLGIPWEPDAVSWLFDNALVPPERLNALATMLGRDADDLVGQDWSTAVEHASAVFEQRQDLSWAAAVMGWSHEKSNDPVAAISIYRRALFGSSFADQSVRFRTHWFPESAGKFVVARLQHLAKQGNLELDADPYLKLFRDEEESPLTRRLTDYWCNVAEIAENEERWADAYNAYYRAGWDLGCDRMSTYEDLLTNMERVARSGGQLTRAELATTHRLCLLARM